MNTQEFQRLRGYWEAKKSSRDHQPLLHGRRHEKGRAKGVSQILKQSFVKPQVGIDRVF